MTVFRLIRNDLVHSELIQHLPHSQAPAGFRLLQIGSQLPLRRLCFLSHRVGGGRGGDQ